MLSTPLNVAVILTGYMLVMGCLAIGLVIQARSPAAPNRRREGAGWPAFVREILVTAVGGYLTLMAVVIGYYYGVARLGGNFIADAFGGSAMLIGLAFPVFLAASWISERRRRRRVRSGRDPRA